MKQKEKQINKNIYNQISKKGLIENDKKLLIKKFGFGNLSYSNLNIDSNISNKNYSLKSYSLSNFKSELKKPLKEYSNIKLNTIQKIKSINNELINQNAKNKNIIKNIKISSNSLKKNRNNKSMAILPISSMLDINGISTYSVKKMKREIHKEERNNNNLSSQNTGTAQNSIKTNQNTFSNQDLLDISPNLKPIRKNKSNQKLKKDINNTSTPSILLNMKKNIIKKKEKPCKIFEKDLYNNHNNKKAKYIMDSPVKKELVNKNINNNINYNIFNTMQETNNKNKKIFPPSEKLYTKNKAEKKEIKKYCITGSNDNSEVTKKESHIEFQNIFNDNILSNSDKKNIINGIISNNMNVNLNNKNLSRNNNSQNINEQITINLENINKNKEEAQNMNKIEENDEFKYTSTQKISITNIDTRIKSQLNDIIKKDSSNNNNENNINNNDGIENENEKEKHNKSIIDNNIFNCEEDEKDEKINYNHNNDNIKEINYSDINNQNLKNNNHNKDDNKDENSSIQTHKNIYKKLCDLNNTKEMSKQEEQLIQGEPDVKSFQSESTGDKNNIISKFIKQPIYNVSPRFIVNEASLNTKHNLPNKSFMFINDIEKENKNIPVLDINKLLNLNEKSIYNLLSFTYDNYSSIISINKLVNNKINNSLKKIFQHVIDDFKLKYSDFLNVLDYSFNTKVFMLNHKKNHLFNLEIRCKIIAKEINKSYEIGCNYTSFSKVYDYIWKFDVKKKDDIKIWLCTEIDMVNNIFKKFSYTSQVSSFCVDDEIIFQFNIFSKGNNIDPISIEWTDPVVSVAPQEVYEKSIFIPKIEYDQLRACEVETQILFWKNKLPEDDRGIINDCKKIFEKCFKIKNIFFDVSKFYFFKIEMKANRIGLIKQNKFSTFDINIIDYESNIINEIQCLYLINSNYYTKKMDIRLGTDITLYIIDMKR